MSATYRNEISIEGHRIDVLKSGMQKYIRRGKLKKALYCVSQLDKFADIEGGERIRTNMIHRLMVIFMEDIGVGNYECWRDIDTFVFRLFEERKREDRDRGKEIGLLRQVTSLLCSSKKTRACSHYKVLLELETKEDKIMSSKFKLGCSPSDTFEGLMEKKDYNAIFKLQELYAQKSFTEIEEVLSKHVPEIDIIVRWRKKLKIKEQILVYILPMIKHIFGDVKSEPTQLDRTTNWDDVKQRPFDAYIYDKHVKESHPDSLKTNEYFVDVSSKVKPEVKVLPGWFKYLYKWKRYDSKVPRILLTKKESDLKIFTRIQLTCGNAKTDTYYANKRWFVKGPFLDDTPVDNFIEIQLKKEKYDLPMSYNCFKVYMRPDIFRDVPLGLRKKTDPEKKYPYLICKSLIDFKDLELIEKESKLWPKTTVVKQENFDMEDLNERELLDYLGGVRFRVKYNIGDLATRNFIRANGRVYSVDEDYTSKEVTLETGLGKRQAEKFTQLYESHKSKLWI